MISRLHPSSHLPATLAPPAAAALLLGPLSIVLGGAWFWPAVCLIAIHAALDRDERAMLVWYALALGFAPQALMLAPFFAAVAIARRVPPATVALAALSGAAMLLARSVADAPPVAPDFPLDTTLALGAPNVWVLVRALPWIGELPLIALALTATAGAAAAYTAWFSARPLAGRGLIDAALLCVLVMAELLPGTDATVSALAAAFASILALNTCEVARWRIAGLAITGSGLAALAAPDVAPLAAMATLLATLLHARGVLAPAANDNPLMARAT